VYITARSKLPKPSYRKAFIDIINELNNKQMSKTFIKQLYRSLADSFPHVVFDDFTEINIGIEAI